MWKIICYKSQRWKTTFRKKYFRLKHLSFITFFYFSLSLSLPPSPFFFCYKALEAWGETNSLNKPSCFIKIFILAYFNGWGLNILTNIPDWHRTSHFWPFPFPSSSPSPISLLYLSIFLMALIPLSMTWPQYLNVNKNNLLPPLPPTNILLYSLIFHFFIIPFLSVSLSLFLEAKLL